MKVALPRGDCAIDLKPLTLQTISVPSRSTNVADKWS